MIALICLLCCMCNRRILLLYGLARIGLGRRNLLGLWRWSRRLVDCASFLTTIFSVIRALRLWFGRYWSWWRSRSHPGKGASQWQNYHGPSGLKDIKTECFRHFMAIFQTLPGNYHISVLRQANTHITHSWWRSLHESWNYLWWPTLIDSESSCL